MVVSWQYRSHLSGWSYRARGHSDLSIYSKASFSPQALLLSMIFIMYNFCPSVPGDVYFLVLLLQSGLQGPQQRPITLYDSPVMLLLFAPIRPDSQMVRALRPCGVAYLLGLYPYYCVLQFLTRMVGLSTPTIYAQISPQRDD
jgi:hypothetical protein